MYLVNGQVFKTQAALTDAIRAVMARYIPGETLDQDDTDFMWDVLAMHPNAAEKMGAGVASIGIQFNAKYRNKEFMLTRTDGTSTDFSYRKCIRPPTNRAQFLVACRQSIAPGIIAFKTLFFRSTPNPVCPLSGEALTPRNCHIDHEPPVTFRYIAERFVIKHKIDMDWIVLKTGGDNNCDVVMPTDVDKLWTDYHWKHAQLRVISAEANLHLGRGENLLYTRPLTAYDIEKREAIRREMTAMGYVMEGAALPIELDKEAS